MYFLGFISFYARDEWNSKFHFFFLHLGNCSDSGDTVLLPTWFQKRFHMSVASIGEASLLLSLTLRLNGWRIQGEWVKKYIHIHECKSNKFGSPTTAFISVCPHVYNHHTHAPCINLEYSVEQANKRFRSFQYPHRTKRNETPKHSSRKKMIYDLEKTIDLSLWARTEKVICIT